MDRVVALASPTGQWPEAIHPRTGGGCMGDGQHAWAAAEWLLMMRALFVREEPDHLVIGAGLPAHGTSDTDFATAAPKAARESARRRRRCHAPFVLSWKTAKYT